MRSKSSGVDTPANGVLGVPQGDQEQEVSLPVKTLKAKVQQKDGEETVEVEVISDKDKPLDSSKAGDKRQNILDLSKEDLLTLLGIMEGEIQVGKALFPFVFSFLYVICSCKQDKCNDKRKGGWAQYLNIIGLSNCKFCTTALSCGLKCNIPEKTDNHT